MAIENILAGAPVTATGGIVHAPVGTTFPDTVRDPWAPEWVKGGYVGEDGVTRTIDASDEKIRAWGGGVVKVVRTEHSVTYTLQFIEARNADTLKLLFGEENVEIDGDDITVDLKGDLTPRRAFGLDIKDGDYKVREYIYDGQPSLTGDVAFVHSDIIRYEVTIEAFENELGIKARSKSGKATAPVIP